MVGRVDADIAKILPLLPLKDAAKLTPRRARDELTALAESRKDMPLPQPASVADIVIPNASHPIPARVYRPANLPAPTVMFFHGGGWVAGDLNTHDRLARLIAVDLDAVVVSVDYRRPPEAHFPAALEDCLAATRWAARNIAGLGADAGRLAVAGDSAGGNLAAAVAQACREEGPALAGQLLIYPATDLAGAYRSDSENTKYPSRAENADGYFLTAKQMKWFWNHYLPSPAEIHEACQRFQAGWDDSERRSRAPWAYSPRVIAVKEFDSDATTQALVHFL